MSFVLYMIMQVMVSVLENQGVAEKIEDLRVFGLQVLCRPSAQPKETEVAVVLPPHPICVATHWSTTHSL